MPKWQYVLLNKKKYVIFFNKNTFKWVLTNRIHIITFRKNYGLHK